MNFKKYILLLLATLFFSVPGFAEKSDFLGRGGSSCEWGGEAV
jgi:hypothetical protein